MLSKQAFLTSSGDLNLRVEFVGFLDFALDVPEETLDGVVPRSVLRQRYGHDAVVVEEVVDEFSQVDARVVEDHDQALAVSLVVLIVLAEGSELSLQSILQLQQELCELVRGGVANPELGKDSSVVSECADGVGLAALRETVHGVVKVLARPVVGLESSRVEADFVNPDESALEVHHVVEEDLELDAVFYHVHPEGLLRQSVGPLVGVAEVLLQQLLHMKQSKLVCSMVEFFGFEMDHLQVLHHSLELYESSLHCSQLLQPDTDHAKSQPQILIHFFVLTQQMLLKEMDEQVQVHLFENFLSNHFQRKSLLEQSDELEFLRFELALVIELAPRLVRYLLFGQLQPHPVQVLSVSVEEILVFERFDFVLHTAGVQPIQFGGQIPNGMQADGDAQPHQDMVALPAVLLALLLRVPIQVVGSELDVCVLETNIAEDFRRESWLFIFQFRH